MERGTTHMSGGSEGAETPPSLVDPELVQEALNQNRACQDSLTAVLDRIQERLDANQMLQRKVKQLIKLSRDAYQRSKEVEGGVRTAGLDWPGRKKAKKKRTSCSRIFVAMDGTGPAENPDIDRTASLQAVLLASTRERRWSDAERAKLRKAVVQQVQERWTGELFARMQKTSQSPGTSQAQTTFSSELDALRHRPVTDEDLTAILPSLNWDRVLEVSELVDRTPEECRSCWLIDGAPGVIRGPWTPEEDERLKGLVAKHEGHEWEAVASELGTRRTAVACLQHYQQDLVQEPQETGLEWPSTPEAAQGSTPVTPRRLRAAQPVRKQQWTEEENLRLQYAVTTFGTSSWVHVAEVVGTRTDPQCRERWVNVLDPTVDSSPWTSEENARLEALVNQLGSGKWAQLAEEFNAGRTLKRTDDRLRKHYEALVAAKMIEPARATPPPPPPNQLQLAVVDPRVVSLTNRRIAAQEREAKRKSTKPPPKGQSETNSKERPKGTTNASQKDSGEIRKTGKSRLSLPAPCLPPLPPGLSTLIKVVHAGKVQPTHVGSKGKPVALVDGKPVHFMQRQIGTQVRSIEVPRAVYGAPLMPATLEKTPKPQNAKATKPKEQTQSTPKPKLTQEERLAQRRARAKKRREAVREQKRLQAEADGTLAQERAAKRVKEEQRQRRAQEKDEASRKKMEDQKAKQLRSQEKQRERREREEARVQRRREKQAQKEEERKQKAEARKQKEAGKAQRKEDEEGQETVDGQKKTGAKSKGRQALKIKARVQLSESKRSGKTVEGKEKRGSARSASLRPTSTASRSRKRTKAEEDGREGEGREDRRPSGRKKPVTGKDKSAGRTKRFEGAEKGSRKRRGEQETAGPAKRRRANAVVGSEEVGKSGDSTQKGQEKDAGLGAKGQTEERQSVGLEGMPVSDEDNMALLGEEEGGGSGNWGRKVGRILRGAKKFLATGQDNVRAGRARHADEGPQSDEASDRGGRSILRGGVQGQESGTMTVQSSGPGALRRSKRLSHDEDTDEDMRATALVGREGAGEGLGNQSDGSEEQTEGDRPNSARKEQTASEIMQKANDQGESPNGGTTRKDIGRAADCAWRRGKTRKQGSQTRGAKRLSGDAQAAEQVTASLFEPEEAEATEAAMGDQSAALLDKSSNIGEVEKMDVPSSKRKRASGQEKAMSKAQEIGRLGGMVLRRSTRSSTQVK